MSSLIIRSSQKKNSCTKCKWLAVVFLLLAHICHADNGYRLWLNYQPVRDAPLASHYRSYFSSIVVADNRYREAIQKELSLSAGSMLSIRPAFTAHIARNGIEIKLGAGYGVTAKELDSLTGEGYRIRTVRDKKRKIIVVQSSSDAGLLYGVFHLIRLMQNAQRMDALDITDYPRLNIRMLNHWDDLDSGIERGYAGRSLWNWDDMDKMKERYIDYARADASLGINGIVINNVNADPRIMRTDYLVKVAALAGILRKYHIRLYISPNFAAPMKPSGTPALYKKWGGIGNLSTADPLDPEVINWWHKKVAEIYGLIPDFGGFLVKANSEGMPGPQDYKRTHADGANMLAKALRPYNGIVIWRTFVYSDKVDKDRMKRAYKEFMPLDGAFDDNVILQAKNGPLDFQPREPVLPLFGAMKKTTVMPELQITQEYMGQDTYLVYLLPEWKEFLNFDTYSAGPGSTVARLIAGEMYPSRYRAMAGVANTGMDSSWTGHQFAQANWYAFGRLAWNPAADAGQITDEWLKMTWNVDKATAAVMKRMMEPTWENFVAGNTPYAMGLTTSPKDHYSPGFESRANKYWMVNKNGIGTDRTTTGTDYVSQYTAPNRDKYNNIQTCPEELLLAMHFVPWNHVMHSGKTFSEEFMQGLHRTVEQADKNIALWHSIRSKIDRERFDLVLAKLQKEKADAEVYYRKGYDFFTPFINENKK